MGIFRRPCGFCNLVALLVIDHMQLQFFMPPSILQPPMQDFPIKTATRTNDSGRFVPQRELKPIMSDEESEARKAAQQLSAQVGRFHAAAAVRAAEEAKIAAVAEILAKTNEEVRIRLAEQARLDAEEEARATREAEVRAKAEAEAEAVRKAAELADAAKVASETSGHGASTTATAKTIKRPKHATGISGKVWYYSCEGERMGPVTFRELRLMAADLSLDPRLDMLWKEGMEMWKPAGEVDGLFERRNVIVTPPRAMMVPVVHQPTRRPQALLDRNASWPGVRRPLFLFGSVLFPFAWYYFVTVAGPNLSKELGPVMMGVMLPFAPVVPVLLVTHLGLQRLANVGMSRWWMLAVFVPILNLWLGYRCLVCPAGYAYHKKLDSAGVILAILYVSLAMLVGLALVAGIALLLDPAVCPEQWLPLREMARSMFQFFQ